MSSRLAGARSSLLLPSPLAPLALAAALALAACGGQAASPGTATVGPTASPVPSRSPARARPRRDASPSPSRSPTALSQAPSPSPSAGKAYDACGLLPRGQAARRWPAGPRRQRDGGGRLDGRPVCLEHRQFELPPERRHPGQHRGRGNRRGGPARRGPAKPAGGATDLSGVVTRGPVGRGPCVHAGRRLRRARGHGSGDQGCHPGPDCEAGGRGALRGDATQSDGWWPTRPRIGCHLPTATRRPR